MAPSTRLRANEKKSGKGGKHAKKSFDALDALLAKNLKKRPGIARNYRKKVIKLPELPPRDDVNMLLSSDCSLHVLKKAKDFENTFDRIKNGTLYNDIKFRSGLSKCLSDSDLISSKLAIVNSVHHSPIMTRSKRKKPTRKRTQLQDSTNIDRSVPTVNNSSPNKTASQEISKGQSYNKTDASFDTLFSKTFRERMPAFNSTPMMKPIDKIKLIDDSNLSPIDKYIKSWNYDPPEEFSQPKPTPIKLDWKIKVSPKVYLRQLPIPTNDHGNVNFNPKVYLTNLNLDLLEQNPDATCKTNNTNSNSGQNDRDNETEAGCTDLVNSMEDVFESNYEEKTPYCKGFLNWEVQLSRECSQNLKETLHSNFENLSSCIHSMSGTPKFEKLQRFVTQRRTKSRPLLPLTSTLEYVDDGKLLDGLKSPERPSVETVTNVHHDHSYSTPNNRKNPILDDIIEVSDCSEEDGAEQPMILSIENEKNNRSKKSYMIKAGKKYRRSLSLLRRSSMIINGNSEKHTKCGPDCCCNECAVKMRLTQCKRKRSMLVPVEDDSIEADTDLGKLAYLNAGYERADASTNLHISTTTATTASECRGTLNNTSSIKNVSRLESIVVDGCSIESTPTAKELVLRRCGQTEPLPFETCYPDAVLRHCQKIGEGLYGEVFLHRNPKRGTSVIKIIPIEGDRMVNGERQKRFDEILSEVVISMELSNLRNGESSNTSAFNELQSVKCVIGCYPQRLIDLWDEWDECHTSENDSPDIFQKDQLFIILELANGGQDLEAYNFNNAEQAFSVFQQIALGLAVAESQLKFEHRDLHWGNVLIRPVASQKKLQFILDDRSVTVKTRGVEVAIIDFTLSRVEFDGVVIYNDLSQDRELFMSEGDYQFDIYRLMQQNCCNDWKSFSPHSNILWLHYILNKILDPKGVRYKNPGSKTHQEHMKKLRSLFDDIHSYKSAVDFVTDTFIL